MSKAGTVQLSDPRADQARPATIMMIAIAAGGLGVLVMLGLARVLPPGTSSRAGPTLPRAAHPRPPAATATESSVHAATAPAAEQPANGPASAGSAPVVTSAPPSRPVTLPSPPPTAPATGGPATRAVRSAKQRLKPTFEQGLVAYVRCEGSERSASRYPCPRDRNLEQQVWRTLGQLVDCTEAEPGRGSAELRLTLQNARTRAVEWKATAARSSLNLRALSKCAGATLANARTSLRTPRAVVSFRFGLK